MVSVSLIRTGAKCETGPRYSRPKILAKNRADSSLSRAGTIVWSRTMVKRASSYLSLIKMSPIAAIGKHQRLRWAPLLLSDWEQGFVTSVHHHTRFFHGAGKNGSPRKFLEGGAPKWPDHPSRRAAADDRSTIPSSDHRP